MSEREKRDKVIRATTDQLLKSNFIQELGAKARVSRTSVNNEYTDQIREVLADIGRDMQEAGEVPAGMIYRGSLSIHVFTAEALKTAAFATLTNLGTLDGPLADGALRELTGSTLLQFGKARPRLRSGF